MRSITVTIIKMRDDEEETESTDDYDIFENINVTKIDLTSEISNAWTNISQKNIVIKEKEKRVTKMSFMKLILLVKIKLLMEKKYSKKAFLLSKMNKKINLTKMCNKKLMMICL